VSDQLVAEAATYKTHNLHMRRNLPGSNAFRTRDSNNQGAVDLRLIFHCHRYRLYT